MSDIRLICFDLNKTIIKDNSWYNLNLALGLTHEMDQELFRQYEQGLITYIEWNQKLLEIFKNHPRANKTEITKILADYEYETGAKEIIQYLKSKGYEVALVSGAMDIVVNMVAKELDIHLVGAANTFIFDENDRLQDILIPDDDKITKVQIMEDICNQLGIGLDQCVCVGDGDNDIDMFRKTGLGVTFMGSKIESEAWKVIKNLTDLENII